MGAGRGAQPKSQEARPRIERLYLGPYLELFGRTPDPGWTVWGNEVPLNFMTRQHDTVGQSGHGVKKASEMIIGIDIGMQGAVAVLDQSGALVEVHDMPTLQDGPVGRRAVNAPLLASIIFASHATAAFVESVNARPGEGPTGAFAFGRARGVIEGVLAAAGIPATFITPPAWKRAVGLTLKSKDAARSEAIRRYPDHAALFARRKDDGRAEAALIAVAGTMRTQPRNEN